VGAWKAWHGVVIKEKEEASGKRTQKGEKHRGLIAPLIGPGLIMKEEKDL